MLIALFTTTALWLLLPFLPALVELRRRKDADPLLIADAYAEDVRHAPHRFAARIRPTLKTMIPPARPAADAPPRHRALPFQARAPRAFSLNPQEAPFILNKRPRHTLPANLSFQQEVYATATVQGGTKNLFMALYSEQDVHLAAESTVLRWLHAQGNITIDAGCHLHGSISAERTLRLGAGCHFERLHAPTIEFGAPKIYALHRLLDAPTEAQPGLRLVDAGTGRPDAPPVALAPFTLPGRYQAAEQHALVQGDLEIPPHHHVAGNLVVQGDLRIGTGCRIDGSVKAHGTLTVAPQAYLQGSVFSQGDLTLGEDVRVVGVASAEQQLTIASGCRLGRPEQPTTVSGQTIHIAMGVRAHGTVWAAQQGRAGRPA